MSRLDLAKGEQQMIITGEDVLWKPVLQRTADLARISELMRLLRPGALPLDVTRLAAVNNSGHAAFYYLEGHIVGCAHLAIYPNLAITMVSLEGVVVDPQFRRLGIARTLVTYLVEYARKRQLQRVVLLTEPENAEARNLYASIGFQEFDLKRFRFYF